MEKAAIIEKNWRQYYWSDGELLLENEEHEQMIHLVTTVVDGIVYEGVGTYTGPRLDKVEYVKILQHELSVMKIKTMKQQLQTLSEAIDEVEKYSLLLAKLFDPDVGLQIRYSSREPRITSAVLGPEYPRWQSEIWEDCADVVRRVLEERLSGAKAILDQYRIYIRGDDGYRHWTSD